jgi:hypothetical protein
MQPLPAVERQPCTQRRIEQQQTGPGRLVVKEAQQRNEPRPDLLEPRLLARSGF